MRQSAGLVRDFVVFLRRKRLVVESPPPERTEGPEAMPDARRGRGAKDLGGCDRLGPR
jgi:hypothetical protein